MCFSSAYKQHLRNIVSVFRVQSYILSRRLSGRQEPPLAGARCIWPMNTRFHNPNVYTDHPRYGAILFSFIFHIAMCFISASKHNLHNIALVFHVQSYTLSRRFSGRQEPPLDVCRCIWTMKTRFHNPNVYTDHPRYGAILGRAHNSSVLAWTLCFPVNRRSAIMY